jgi:hypothetical protein
MTRLGWLAALMTIVAASGCSICCTPFDDAYPTYGGKWERTDRFRGRVGSAFEPAGPTPVDETVLHEPTPAVQPPEETLAPAPDGVEYSLE